MRTFIIMTLLAALISFESQAQQETPTKQQQAKKDTTATVDLLGEMNQAEPEKAKLLPDKIMFTQRIFWGEKGLMRNFNAFELTPDKRMAELKFRRTMLATHQVLGVVTLGGMIAQGIVGAKLYNYSGNDYESLKHTHEVLGTAVAVSYFSTAAMSLFAPPKMLNERKGYSSIKLHKGLAMIHLTGMITTLVLGSQIEQNPNNLNLKSWHRAAAYTTFGAYAASMIVIKF